MLKKLISKILAIRRNHSCVHNSCSICDSEEEKHFFIDSGYIAVGKNYIKNCENARSINRKDAFAGIPNELIYAHDLLLGVMGSMLEENNGKRVPAGDSAISRRFVLTAAFVQGISLCEQSILEGLYLQAGNLIRQEFETLGLIDEINKNKRSDRKNVNAKYAPWNGSKHYGELSALAHLSDHRILDSIIGYNTTWGDYAATVPQYQKDTTIRLYDFHISMMLKLVYEIKYLYGEVLGYNANERENNVIGNVVGILEKHKILKEKG